jgi:internalin A
MPADKALQNAEEKIAEALRTGATELDLSCEYNADDSEKLTELPESLGQLTQLQTLNLSGNQLTALPESLGQLTQLQTLNLSRNQLTALPESLGQLTQLQTLNLSRNQLTALPESLGQLTQLQTLDLSGNQLTALPESLGQLTQLQWLSFSENQLTALPEWLGQLTQLQTLDLYDNQLTALPKSLGQLAQLRRLLLYNNRLKALPNSIAHLKHLQLLSLHRNQLTELTESLLELESLKELWLPENESLGLPTEVIEKARDPRAILEYYFSTRGEQGRALRELKLIVVGRGGAGKTSLVRRLDGQKLNPRESETHGINISPLSLDCEDGPVTARVWDFGGQHVLHAMHEFFLTARSLYLLVLGEREDMAERDAAYWLQLIRSYAGDAPVVVALNKSQGRPREMDQASLERNYGPILAWVATECAEGFDPTIADLRTALTAAAEGMPEIRQKFPAKWWEIKEWLENMSEPYLDYAAYQDRCRKLGEQDGDNQEQLAGWLNDLGIAINYADDERLHDTTVLRPDWLANGIYAILRANDSAHDRHYAPDAMLTEQRLGPIYAAAQKLKMLKAKEYPPAMWPFLLRLMNLFQLAFPVDDRGEKLLVPTLLPLEPPEGCDEPQDADRTRLRYEFAVVPGPLLPKLLVRTFSLIEGDRRWRRGAILRYGNATARVWTTQDERWIRITAAGGKDDRDELLTMIRLTLQKLFAEYRDLRAIEQWEHEGQWVPRRTLEDIGVLPREDDRREVR